MRIADKLTAVAENVPKVYAAGKQAEYDRFWNCITDNGTRTSYQYAFSRWNAEYIRPPVKLVSTEAGSLANTFMYCSRLKRVEAAYFDFFQVPRGKYQSQGAYYTFVSCAALEEIEDIGLPALREYCYTFAYCGSLRRIACLRCDENTVFTNTFQSCNKLEDIRFEGVIGKSIDFSCSPLNGESVQSVIDHLADLTGETAQTLTFHATVGAALTEEQKAAITAKNWTLVY